MDGASCFGQWRMARVFSDLYGVLDKVCERPFGRRRTLRTTWKTLTTACRGIPNILGCLMFSLLIFI